MSKKVVVQIGERTVKVIPGTQISSLLSTKSKEKHFLGALFNNRLVSLDDQIWGSGTCQFIEVQDEWMGASIYRRSVTLLLYEAAYELYPELKLEIGQAIGNGYHFQVLGQTPAPENWIEQLSQKCLELIKQERPFIRSTVNIEEANALFEKLNAQDKNQLLRVWNIDLVHLITLGKYYDIQHGPVAPTTGHIQPFKLTPFPDGFVLDFQQSLQIGYGQKPQAQKKLFQSYQETRHWNRILGVTSVGQLNELALGQGLKDLIHISEGFHEKKIVQIADEITKRKQTQLILISGPSSAGKTTFAKRLSIQLRVNGIQPVSISMDDYYLNWEQMPLQENGDYDFESVHSLDLPLFNRHLSDLLAGKEVVQPTFNFSTGKRNPKEQSHKLSIAPGQILIVEGIHGLNPMLTSAIPDNLKYKVFINALTQLNLDRSNRLFTSETRLLRRIVRDRRYRGYSAAHTIKKWPAVREGERKFIFPYQESADALFNSTLVYETCVLKHFADRYLLEVSREDPTFAFAHRLRNFLQLFVPITHTNVPRTSLIREFIGDAESY